MKKALRAIASWWNSLSLIIRILIGLLLGSILGICCPGQKWIALFGSLFVGSLKAIAPLLVALLVMSSIAKAGAGIGKRFVTVISMYLMTTLISALVAVVASTLFPVRMVLTGGGEAVSAPDGLTDVFENLLMGMVANPIHSVSNANYLGILFWAVILGLALKKIASRQTIDMLSDLAMSLSKVVSWVIQLAPLGIMGLVFSAVSENGLDIFVNYGKLIALLVGCMLFVALVANPAIIAAYLRRNPYPLVFRCLKASGINAFFTRSSAANIPINMDLCRKMELDEDFYSVSIPLGSTINMNGAAITITVMTLSVCHTLGIAVSFPTALLLSVIATLGACGASGVAGGSLLLIPMACSLFGIGADVAMQAISVGFIISVIQDSMETALNSSGDVMFTATADWYEKRKTSPKATPDC